MQINYAQTNIKQKDFTNNNPLKQLFSTNLSPRYKLSEHNKQKPQLNRKQIGNKYCYSTDDLIGDGYTSKVYKAYELQKINKTYAVKVIEKSKLQEDQIKLIKNQLEVHPKLDHQNIVKCYDVYDTQKILYIVMQYCPNGDLSQFIKQNKQKSISQLKAIQYMQQIIQGYKYLVSQGILHRDLKPANILKCGRTLKIADFGFAIKGKKTIIDNMNVGTPLYMPPQSIQQCVYSHKSDFFALGCIFYQILHAKTPWYKSDQKALATIMKKRQIDLSSIKNHNIKQFILGACQISQTYRMSIQQFMQFDLRKPATSLHLNLSNLSNPESVKNARSFLRQKSDRKLVSKKSHQQTAKSIKSKKSQTTMQGTFVSNHTYFKNANNQQITRITCQFQQKYQFCLLLKYLIQNSQNTILIEEFEKKNLKIVLFKHCLYMMKKLLNDCTRIKTFDPKSWESFKQTQQFKFFFQQSKAFKQKMQKDFNMQLKGMSLKNLSQINKKFPQLNCQYQLPKTFYQKLKEFLQDIMRKFHAQILKRYPKSNKNILQQKSVDVNAKYFEAFRSLNLYYQHNQQKINTQIQNFNKSSGFLTISQNLNRVSTTKNSNTNSNSTTTSFKAHKINSSFMRNKQTGKSNQKIQLIQGVKSQKKRYGYQKDQVNQKQQNHKHYYNYFALSSSQYDKNSFKSKQNSMNMTSTANVNSKSSNYGQNVRGQYYHQHSYNKNIQNQNNCNRNNINSPDNGYKISIKKIYANDLKQQSKQKLNRQQKSTDKKINLLGSQKHMNNTSKTVQDFFSVLLCRNYQQSKMNKEEFAALKKKIKWLW